MADTPTDGNVYERTLDGDGWADVPAEESGKTACVMTTRGVVLDYPPVRGDGRVKVDARYGKQAVRIVIPPEDVEAA